MDGLAATSRGRPFGWRFTDDITKTHQGNIPLGGFGTYTITVTNSGADPTTGQAAVNDFLPTGLLLTSVTWEAAFWDCDLLPDQSGFQCSSQQALPPGESYTFNLTVTPAPNPPCTVTNTVTVSGGGSATDSASDPTTLVGGNCTGGGGGGGRDDDDDGGGSILPVNLNGVIPMFNNISTNNNIHSPGAGNNSSQDFDVTAP